MNDIQIEWEGINPPIRTLHKDSTLPHYFTKNHPHIAPHNYKENTRTGLCQLIVHLAKANGFYDPNNTIVFLPDQDLQLTLNVRAFMEEDLPRIIENQLEPLHQEHRDVISQPPKPFEIYWTPNTCQSYDHTNEYFEYRSFNPKGGDTIAQEYLYSISNALSNLLTANNISTPGHKVYTYMGIREHIIEYLEKYDRILLDPRHPDIVLCHNTPFGDITHFKAFHKRQLRKVINHLITPYKSQQSPEQD